MDEEMLTTERVRRTYYLHAYNPDWEAWLVRKFDHWFASEIAKARTAALEEAAVIAEQHSAHSGHCSGCDMALVIAATIRSEKVAES